MTTTEELRAAATRFEGMQGPAAPALTALLRFAAQAIEEFPELGGDLASADVQERCDAHGSAYRCSAYRLLVDQVACARDVARASLTGVRS